MYMYIHASYVHSIPLFFSNNNPGEKTQLQYNKNKNRKRPPPLKPKRKEITLTKPTNSKKQKKISKKIHKKKPTQTKLILKNTYPTHKRKDRHEVLVRKRRIQSPPQLQAMFREGERGRWDRVPGRGSS